MPAAPSRPMKSTCPTRRLWTPSARASKARVFFGLVHNAGQPYDALAAMMQQDKAEAAMQVNFWSFTRIAKALMRGMIRAKQGRIVAIGSVAALQGNPGNAAYAASKGALISYCRTLSRRDRQARCDGQRDRAGLHRHGHDGALRRLSRQHGKADPGRAASPSRRRSRASPPSSCPSPPPTSPAQCFPSTAGSPRCSACIGRYDVVPGQRSRSGSLSG